MSEFNTPMMKQYEDIKRQYSDCLLFYRLGDFYELFVEDAHVGAQVLGLTLTGRPRGKDGRIPMAGVPFHAVDSYISKLVSAGYKVAICEQVSQPDKYGIVEREVVRIVTPGTVLDEKTLDRKENNYIVCLNMDDKLLGIACADISTGQFQVSEFPLINYEQTIINEFSRINPSECILPKFLYDNPSLLKLLKLNKGLNIYCFHNWNNYALSPTKYLTDHFRVKSLMSFGIEKNIQSQTTASALLGYLKDTQKNKIEHFKSITALISDQHIQLDRSTIVNLELFTTLRDGQKQGSLLSVIDKTVTAMGARMLKEWIRKPLTNKEEILNRQDAVLTLKEDSNLLDEVHSLLREITDIERTISRLSVGIGNARDMIGLKNSLNHILAIKARLQISNKQILLNSIESSIHTKLYSLVKHIEDNILEEPKFDLKEGGIIKPGINQELDRLRDIVYNGNEWVQNLEKKERERTGISSLKVRFNKVFGFYIEVSNANLSFVPKDYTRKQTLVNGERFITPELKKQEEIILSAEETVNSLEYEIYTKVLKEIVQMIEILQNAAHSIAQIDCLISFAIQAKHGRYVRPSINNDGQIQITNGRHPVVEQFLVDRSFVPNTVTLDNNQEQLWIITGPNMAGKSVFIRQVAIIVLLSQIGSFVPAESANLAIVDKIFVRSGASDIISEGLSTFMVEMVETAQILNQATSHSLIIMDEIGRGTSTYDGISIAWAVAEYLVTNKLCAAKTLFATHYHELQDLEERYPNKISNYHMDVVEQDGELHFLHTIKKGGASHSFGVAVAKLAGVPEEVIQNAYQMLFSLEKRDRIPQIPQLSNHQLPLSFGSNDNIIIQELSDLDIHQMTPLQALNKIAELKSKMRLIPSATEI